MPFSSRYLESLFTGSNAKASRLISPVVFCGVPVVHRELSNHNLLAHQLVALPASTPVPFAYVPTSKLVTIASSKLSCCSVVVASRSIKKSSPNRRLTISSKSYFRQSEGLRSAPVAVTNAVFPSFSLNELYRV